jgi:hypothetical protein
MERLKRAIEAVDVDDLDYAVTVIREAKRRARALRVSFDCETAPEEGWVRHEVKTMAKCFSVDGKTEDISRRAYKLTPQDQALFETAKTLPDIKRLTLFVKEENWIRCHDTSDYHCYAEIKLQVDSKQYTRAATSGMGVTVNDDHCIDVFRVWVVTDVDCVVVFEPTDELEIVPTADDLYTLYKIENTRGNTVTAYDVEWTFKTQDLDGFDRNPKNMIHL